MEALLTREAVAATAASKMWEVAPAAQRAVLQVVDVSWFREPPLELDESSRRRSPWTEVHKMVLSDGVHTLGEFSLSTPRITTSGTAASARAPSSGSSPSAATSAGSTRSSFLDLKCCKPSVR
ncbi:unnamed protein product [Urochloa humidicola]